MNSCISWKTQKQMFLLVSGGHIRAPQRDTNMASPYEALSIWVKRFSLYLAYEISHRPDSWWGLLLIYLLLFPIFWTFCIEWFAILFLIAWQWKPRFAAVFVSSRSVAWRDKSGCEGAGDYAFLKLKAWQATVRQILVICKSSLYVGRTFGFAVFLLKVNLFGSILAWLLLLDYVWLLVSFRRKGWDRVTCKSRRDVFPEFKICFSRSSRWRPRLSS